VALLFVLPLAGLVRMSLSEQTRRFSLDATFTGRIANYTEVLVQYGPVLWRSLAFAGVATLLCGLIGYPMAYAITRQGGRWKPLLLGLVVVPFFTSFLIRTIAWSTLLADQGPVLAVLSGLGLIHPLERFGLVVDGRLLNTPAAVLGGLAYNGLPFMILPLVVSLEKIDPRLLEAAADLHARGWRTFRRVIWPLSLPGLVAGVLLTFIPAAGDLVNAQYLGGPGNRMIGNSLQNLLLVQNRYPAAAALAVSLMVMLSLLVVLSLGKLDRDTLTGP
jgi:spermidine/putrescine transport system permease protein